MPAPRKILYNTPEIEIWPSDLLRARSNADARILARANQVLRRKRDGRYLAAVLPNGILPLLPRWSREPGVDDALDVCESAPLSADCQGELPLGRLPERLNRLGLDEAYGPRVGLALVAEPTTLRYAGRDRFQRPLWLQAATARAWQHLRLAAAREGIALDAISGYRSHDYQLGIFERKLARGQTVAQILQVNAAPGYSQHHSGRALDIGTADNPPAETSFEQTAAFAWLTAHANEFGFVMSYPRDNPHGIIYEPWHWYWRGMLSA